MVYYINVFYNRGRMLFKTDSEVSENGGYKWQKNVIFKEE